MRDGAAPESRAEDSPLATTAFVLSVISAITYFATSRGIRNFVLFLMDGAAKALRHFGIGA